MRSKIKRRLDYIAKHTIGRLFDATYDSRLMSSFQSYSQKRHKHYYVRIVEITPSKSKDKTLEFACIWCNHRVYRDREVRKKAA